MSSMHVCQFKGRQRSQDVGEQPPADVNAGFIHGQETQGPLALVANPETSGC